MAPCHASPISGIYTTVTIEAGVAAAIPNAIFHATGKRLRSTPMSPDKLLMGDHEAPVRG
jgi:CO/xanthine dehydrogenase Mo-binding subunit